MRRREGSAFIIALGVLVILFIMAITFATMMVMESRAARNYNDAALCENVAYGALEEGINALFRDKYGEDASVVAGSLVLQPYNDDAVDENWDAWAYPTLPGHDGTLWFRSDGGRLSEDASATDAIEDATKSWPTDIWQNATVQVAGQMRTVQSNDDNTITVTVDFDTEPRQGDRYIVFFWYPRDAAGDPTLRALPGGLSARYAILITDDREARVNVNTAGNLAEVGPMHGSNMGASVTEVSLEALLGLFNDRDGNPIGAPETLAEAIILARCTPPGGGTTEPGSDNDDDNDNLSDGVDNNGDGVVDEANENENEDDEFNSLFALEDTPFALPDEAAILASPADSGAVTSSGVSSLTDNTKSWIVNEWTDATVGVDNAGADGILDEFRTVTGNTSATLNVDSAWVASPDAYAIYYGSPLEAILANTNASLRAEATGTSGLTLADCLTTYSAGTVEHPYIDSAEIPDLSDRYRRYRFGLNQSDTGDTGTVNSAKKFTLTDTDKSWTEDEWINASVGVDTDGDGTLDQFSTVTGNTSDTLNVLPAWEPIPSEGNSYCIYARLVASQVEDLKALLETKGGLTQAQAYQMIVNLNDALDGDTDRTVYTVGVDTYIGLEADNLLPFITEVFVQDLTPPGEPPDPDKVEYVIELYNPGVDEVNIKDWVLSTVRLDGTTLDDYPSFSTINIPAGEYLVLSNYKPAKLSQDVEDNWDAGGSGAIHDIGQDIKDLEFRYDGSGTTEGDVISLREGVYNLIIDKAAFPAGIGITNTETAINAADSIERSDYRVDEWTETTGNTLGSAPDGGYNLDTHYLSILTAPMTWYGKDITYNMNLANLGDLARILIVGYNSINPAAPSLSQSFKQVLYDPTNNYKNIKFDLSDATYRQVLDYLTVLNPMGDNYDDDNDGTVDDTGPTGLVPAGADDLGGPEHRIPGMININTASREVLMALPGVDDNLADVIIANRPYTDIGDLLEKDIGGNYLVTGIDALGGNNQDDNGNGIVDEKEEEFLIFGALSNIVTTHSNVFTVYCLAQVGIWNDLNDDDIVDPDEFTIFAERELMAIVDRSTQPINVRFQRWLTD